MVDAPKNIAASVKQRLLNMARAQGRAFDILLVRFALERLLFRLSQSAHRDNYILKGGMLVTQWLDHDNRETRDADFLGFGEADVERLRFTLRRRVLYEERCGPPAALHPEQYDEGRRLGVDDRLRRRPAPGDRRADRRLRHRAASRARHRRRALPA